MRMKLTSMRISIEQHDKADRLVEYFGQLNHAPSTRSDVFRAAIARGLAELEEDQRRAEGAANASV